MEQIEWRRCNDLTTSDYAFLGQLLSLHNINIDFICTFLFPLLYDSPGVFGWLCLQNWNMHHMNTNKYTSVSIYTCHQLNSFYSTVLQQIVKKNKYPYFSFRIFTFWFALLKKLLRFFLRQITIFYHGLTNDTHIPGDWFRLDDKLWFHWESFYARYPWVMTIHQIFHKHFQIF